MFKLKLREGKNIVSIPIPKKMKIEDIFPRELSGAIIERLDDNGRWVDKEEINFINNMFETKNYKFLYPLEILRLTLRRDLEIKWDLNFFSYSQIYKSIIDFEEGFDFEEALHLAMLCELVYKDKNVIYDVLKKYYDYDEYKFYDKRKYKTKNTLLKILFTIIDYDDVVDLQFLRLVKKDNNGNYIVVFVFRGSDSYDDWINNFNYKKCDFEIGDVHSGFQNEYKCFIDIIKEENVELSKLPINSLDIDEINKKNIKILLAGHSKGGAVATLVGCYLSQIGIKKENFEVYTFGAPPVGDKDFANYFENKINLYRIINSEDIVPKLDKILGFKHFGKEIILETNDDNSHSIKEYINNLIEYISKRR